MKIKWMRCLLALSTAAIVLLSACAPAETANPQTQSDALTWCIWGNSGTHKRFLDLLNETHPDIQLKFIPYSGANRTGYSWAQMRGDDIPDIFITSLILDEDLARERLVDLSAYSFIGDLSTSILDQVSIDSGIYLLPTSNSMYGIYYNKTLMEEHGWELPSNFAELEALCAEIRAAGLIPGVLGTQFTGGPFSTVFNLAKTSWLTTPEGRNWEQDFLAGNATAKGRWEETMEYVQKYIDIGMFHTDPNDAGNPAMILDYLGQRKAVFSTVVLPVNITELPETGDKLGLMPFIGEDGSKNIYMYSPPCYFGLSKRLEEPGNEEKLEKAIRLLTLMFSPEGQATFIDENTPCVMSVLSNTTVSENSLIYDAQQAMWDGRAFPMTYTHWEAILTNIGQAYKEWFRGENGMDGPGCIARMDELQQDYLNQSEQLFFCESMADFTLEQTGTLIGKALGSAVGADAVMIPLDEFHEGSTELCNGASGKLYQGKINQEIFNTILPAYDGEYALMTMTGAQAQAVAQAGFDQEGTGNPYPYLLVVRGDAELDGNTLYQVAFLMKGYTEETAQKYSAQVHDGSLAGFLRTYLEEQRQVSPDGNPWIS